MSWIKTIFYLSPQDEKKLKETLDKYNFDLGEPIINRVALLKHESGLEDVIAKIIKNNDLDSFKILTSIVNVNHIFKKSHKLYRYVTFLEFAAEKNSKEIFEFLVEECLVDLNDKIICSSEIEQYLQEKCAVFYSCKEGKTDLVINAIKNDKRIATQRFNKKSLLEIAVKYNNLELVKYLIEETRVNKDFCYRSIRESIKRAVKNNNLELVKYLFEESPVNVGFCYSYKKLTERAVENNNLELAKYLLEKNQADAYDYSFMNLLDIAVENRNLELAKYLIGKISTTRYSRIIHSKVIENCKNGDLEELKFYNALNITVKNLLQYAKDLDTIKYIVEELLEDVNSKDQYGKTALIRAVENGRVDIARYLIENAHADLDIKDIYGTALHYAIRNNNVEIVKMLIDNNANFALNNYDNSVLCLALLNEDIDFITHLVVDIKVNINAKSKEGKTVMHCAIENKFPLKSKMHLNTIKYLCSKLKANINEKDNKGKTAFQLALNSDYNLETIKFFVDKCGADITIVDQKRRATMILAIIGNASLDVISYLKEKTDYKNVSKDIRVALSYSIKNENFEVFKYIVDNYKKVEKWGLLLSEELFYACKHNNLEIVKYLIFNGVNVNIENSKKETALFCACKNNNLEIVKYLIDKGAKVNIENSKEETTLFYACKNNNLEMIKCFIDEERKDDAFDYACKYCDLKIIKFAYEKYKDSYYSRYHPYTPRIILALKNPFVNLEIIKFLHENCNDILDDEKYIKFPKSILQHLDIFQFFATTFSKKVIDYLCRYVLGTAVRDDKYLEFILLYRDLIGFKDVSELRETAQEHNATKILEILTKYDAN